MTSTFVPAGFVRSQFFWMPGEERKFSRSKRTALPPTFKRECDEAESQAVTAMGTASGVDVSDAADVEVGEGRVVPVGSIERVEVGDRRGVTVTSTALVSARVS